MVDHAQQSPRDPMDKPASSRRKTVYGRVVDGSKTPPGCFNIWFWLIALGSFLLMQGLLSSFVTERLSHTEFVRPAEAGRIESVQVSERCIQSVLLPESPSANTAPRPFVTTRVDPELVEELTARGLRSRARLRATSSPYSLSWVVRSCFSSGCGSSCRAASPSLAGSAAG